MRLTTLFPCFLAFNLILISCSQQQEEVANSSSPNESKLGVIQLEVSGLAEAQPFFEKGLLLLHSFEYEDAKTEFVKAQEIDTTFVMAYWGEAMTYHHSLWQRQEKEKALEALNKIAPTPEERQEVAKTQLEKDFLQATDILFGEGTKYERDLAYRDYMKKLSQKYPNNHEISAFYAISLLGSSRNGRDEELYEKCARIAKGIVKENPKHPGALHYLIHSYDDPGHAHLAKNAADNYSQVAPDAAHALHMPSHIYVALGHWNDVVTSNIASWNASVNRVQRKGLKEGESYHALNWLQYGLLQRGEVATAEELLDKMVIYSENNPTSRARSYLIAMKGAQMVETNTWEGSIADIEVDVADLSITNRSGLAFLEGMKAYAQQDKENLSQIIATIEEDRLKATNLVGDKGFAMCSAGGFASKPPNQLDIDMVHVMEMELKAFLALLDENSADAKQWFEEAVSLDESLSYSFGPPSIFKPAHEAYAEWLLSTGQAKEATEMFQKSLKRHPRRLLSLKGLKLASEQIEDENTLVTAQKELEISLSEKERSTIL